MSGSAVENHTLCYDWVSIILITCFAWLQHLYFLYLYSFQVKPCYFRGSFPLVKISVTNCDHLSFFWCVHQTYSVSRRLHKFLSWPHFISQCLIYHKHLSWTETFLDYVIIEICMYPVINILPLMCKYFKLMV